jgi:hypothetical protein
MAVFTGLGSAASPSITFSADTNTGIFSPGADQVAVATNGTQRLTVSTAATTSTLPIVHPPGTAGAPSITFTGDLNTGFWSPSTNTLAWSTSGVERARITSTNLGIGTSLDISTAAEIEDVVYLSSPLVGGLISKRIALATNGAKDSSIDFGYINRGSNFASTLTFRTTLDNSNRNVARMHIDQSGSVGIGGTLPSAPNINLAATGAIDAVGRVLSAPVMGHSHGQSAPATAEITNRITAMWLSASARGSWVRSGASGGFQYTSFRTGSNNSHLVWDLLLHNCTQVICSLIYVNAADSTSRSISSEYSVDGGSTWVALGDVTAGSTGGAEFGGTITFGTGTAGVIRYLKVRAFYTSGALSSNFIGIRNVTFTPTCTSAQFTNSLNTL